MTKHPGLELLNYLENQPLLNVGIYDALSAAMAAQHPKTRGLFLSGLGLTYARYGLPDIGLIEASDVRECARIIRSNHPKLFLTCDIDSGLGGIEQLRRTCVDLRNLGVAAVQLEDQTIDDKRCGHMDGKCVRPIEEAVARLRVAIEAAHPMQVIARTDAPMHNGEALERIEAFISAGATIVLVDGIDKDDLLKVVSAVDGRAHIMANVVHGGKLSQLPATEFHELGVSIINQSTPLLAVAMTAMKQAMEQLMDANERPIPKTDGMPLSEANKLVTENYDKYTAPSRHAGGNLVRLTRQPQHCNAGIALGG